MDAPTCIGSVELHSRSCQCSKCCGFPYPYPAGTALPTAASILLVPRSAWAEAGLPSTIEDYYEALVPATSRSCPNCGHTVLLQ